MATLTDLVDIVRQLTPFFARGRQGKKFNPDPMQIVYFTLNSLRQRGVLSPDDLERQEFSKKVVEAFWLEALKVARLLVTEYPRIQKLLRELQGTGPQAAHQRLHSWISEAALFQVPALPRHPALRG